MNADIERQILALEFDANDEFLNNIEDARRHLLDDIHRGIFGDVQSSGRKFFMWTRWMTADLRELNGLISQHRDLITDAEMAQLSRIEHNLDCFWDLTELVVYRADIPYLPPRFTKVFDKYNHRFNVFWRKLKQRIAPSPPSSDDEGDDDDDEDDDDGAPKPYNVARFPQKEPYNVVRWIN